MPAKTTPRTAPPTPRRKHQDKQDEPAVACLNEVVLVGRVSAVPEERELPSGAPLVTLRVVVDRPPPKGTAEASRRRAVDVIDVACWSRRTQRTAGSLLAGDVVRVEGTLRRRFFAAGGARASRYEVEAERLTRVSRSTSGS